VHLAVLNEPLPQVDALVALWTAGDPFTDTGPTVIADWVLRYDGALQGRVLQAMHATGFAWQEGQRLWVPTGGDLPFDALALVGATPAQPNQWQGWDHVGRLVRRALQETEVRHVGLLIDRIFATGVEDLAAGLCAPLGAKDTLTLESLVVTGSIDWAQADLDALGRGCRRGRRGLRAARNASDEA